MGETLSPYSQKGLNYVAFGIVVILIEDIIVSLSEEVSACKARKISGISPINES